MDRLLRTLIYIFSGLIVVFSLLILVNYIGSLTGATAEPQEREEKPASASEQAQQALNAAKYGAVPRGGLVPGGYRKDLSSAAVNAEGSINLVREKEFGGVAETPKGMMEMLSELSGGKKKPSPVALKDSDLDKKITVGKVLSAEPKLHISTMPEMGRAPGQEGRTMFSAPVDYKVFKSSDTWKAFADSHKYRHAAAAQAGLKPAVSRTPAETDFSREAVLVLVSVSELPNGIFEIVELERSGGGLVVRYRVDPMGMAAGGGLHDSYSAAVIHKGAPLRLEQVP